MHLLQNQHVTTMVNVDETGQLSFELHNILE